MKKTILKLLLLIMLCTNAAYAQNVRGRVTSSMDNSAIPGVSIVLQGTSKGTVTDVDGNYTLDISGLEEPTLIFSFVGFVTEDIPVNNRTTVDLAMVPDLMQLEEVTVTAMGIEREQRKIGYAVSTIKSKDILQASPTNVGSALYGKTPGVAISTNAGGATSAVAIDIRGGMNSLGFQRQPLLVVDGVISRNGEANNGGFWDDQRIRGNGILDINPENIETLTILKGAAASALYGSDAASGVIVVTTKKGRDTKGIGIDFSTTYGMENVGILPDVQSTFGPGYARSINQSNFGANDEGFIMREVRDNRIWIGDPNVPGTINIPAPAGYSDGDYIAQPLLNAWGQFGPRFDGRDAVYWDGEVRPYVGYEDNMRNFYRTGYNEIYNVAISNRTEKGSHRLSYTRNNYRNIMEGGPQNKNTFSLNSNYLITPKLDISLVANYMNEHVNNRAYMIDRLTNNYTGFLGAGNNIAWFEQNYKTSRGFRYVTAANRAQDPDEAFLYNTAGTDYMNYFWDTRERQYDEYTNRLMGAATLNYKILENLNIRTRLGTDYTGYTSENKEPNIVPLAIGTSGFYSTASNKMSIIYGDVLATYNTEISSNLGLTVQVGYQGREESYLTTSQETQGGLSQVNWFSMSASNQNPRGYSRRQTLVKDGLFGIIGFDLNDYLFIEGSLRQERTSTLYPGNNVFYFPSVSAAFELSSAFNLPSYVDFSKLRSSFGIVGNPPNFYAANVVYNAHPVSGVPSLVPPSNYGNNELKNEIKHEYEIGWETSFFRNRLGFNFTYYNNKINDMINQLDVTSTTGSSSIIQNVGSMSNYGVELGLNFTPVRMENFSWETNLNASFNRNKLLSLMPGTEFLQHSNIDNGSLYIRSEVGQAAGDIFGYTLTRHENGELLVNEDGFYVPDYDNLVRLGNVQAKSVGGLINNFTYKNLYLNTVIDYRWGGQVVSPSIQYGRSAGIFEETLFGRDAETGGLPYYVNEDGNFISADGLSQGPTGQPIFNDGMLLTGVTAGGEQNSTIIESGEYYRQSYYWGSYPGSGRTGTYETAVFDNNYIRLRELSIGYQLPKSLAGKVKAQSLTISAYGRNLFFIHKSLPHYDSEATVGTDWITRANIGNAGAVPRSLGLTLRGSF